MKQKDSLLAQLRKTLGLSQGDIAGRLGISRPTYVLVESGAKELTLGQAEILSHLYSVSVETLRTGKPQSQNQSNDIVSTQLPTKNGLFNFGVWNQPKGDEIIFLTTPNLDLEKPVLVRVHSECMTGDVFHSYRCDCGEQKDESMRMISESGNGVLIYLRQEGRGIGLHEKIKAYNLQDQGYDTHEANILLGHKPDYREYSWVKKVLSHLNVQNIRLITNNPSKVTEIARLGVKVIDRVPLLIESNQHNRRYFETKRQKFKHFFGNSEGNYFYQFSDTDSPEQVEEVGKFLATFVKDPQLKICVGTCADSHTLNDPHALKNLEAIFKATEHYEGFVPILHFTFKFSEDAKADIAGIRKKMPFVQYLQLNDVDPKEYLDVIKYANKFFLTDIPLDNETFDLINDPEFIKDVLKHKSFVLLDNSKGKGLMEPKESYEQKINQLLEAGINDIAVYGGFGPGSLDTYFDLCNHYKLNFSIDAESKLKTDGRLDVAKVKEYLSELMSHKNIVPKRQFIDATRNLIAQTDRTVIAGVSITTDPEVFNPTVFFSSEWFAEYISKLVRNESTFIEVGCGTGIVSIKSVLDNPALTVYATDISKRAAEVTKINAEKNNVADRVHAYSGDVFDGLPKKAVADSIFWAMPFGYLEPGEQLTGNDSQTFDPGYRAIKKFFTDAKKHLKDDGRLLIGFSVDIGHYELLEQIAIDAGFSLNLLEQTKGVEKDAVSMEIYEARIK